MDRLWKGTLRIFLFQLMTDLGIIKPAMVGCFHFLPLGIRAIDKLSKLVQEEMESIEAQKISMPFLSSTDLWLRTGQFSSRQTSMCI